MRVAKTQHHATAALTSRPEACRAEKCAAGERTIPVQPGDPEECADGWMAPGSSSERTIRPAPGVRSYFLTFPVDNQAGHCTLKLSY
jgi:hypothetical protein